MIDDRGRLIHNREVAPQFFLARFELPQISRYADPGQFVHLRIERSFDPFLRMPISVCRSDSRGGWIEILYEVVGPGTSVLSQMEEGAVLDFLGPLGRGYRLPRADRKAILVAGGIGVAPLIFLSDRLREHSREILFLMGATSMDRLLDEILETVEGTVYVATDDGSKGYPGPVTELLISRSSDMGDSEIFTCGPRPMMEEVARISKEFRVPCQVSLEEYMACGHGACLGCVVEVRSTEGGGSVYKRICTEGPVFEADEVFYKDLKVDRSVGGHGRH